ncbi:glycosyltransferase [Kitasatospora sp. NBC_00315]|uniref:glycosyltransferase n=1 Tax=Kitasatospora sp. NBC_00315 TaxID=2975963 RepID=UPI00324AD5D6
MEPAVDPGEAVDDRPPSPLAARSGAEEDPLVRLRQTFWCGRPDHPRRDRSDLPVDPGGDLLTLLARAEYGPGGPGRAELPAADRWTAELRRACREGRPPAPAHLLAWPAQPGAGRVPGSAEQQTALAEAWALAVAGPGRGRGTAALRSRLLAASPAEAAFLLDLADAHGLRPLRPAEAAVWTAAGRPARHAAWRYLSGLPGGERLLPAPGPAGVDPYERLLLAAARRRAGADDGPGSAFRTAFPVPRGAERPGLVVAQSMLLGRLDAPGQGLSGGLSVLLGGLGDALACTDGVARVLTLVTAAGPELATGLPLLDRRTPDHWVLRLPVDGDEPPAPRTVAAHRAALAWWAALLLRGLGRPVDVVHVRYADDGSLAVAEAAGRIGARLVFTVTPDPHRTVRERYAGLAPQPDPALGPALREDLHRIFVADRLVERADTVVAIAGREGAAPGLVRHFPQLGPEHRTRPPAAPPEGIAPLRPESGDGRRRRALLTGLFGSGTGPGGPEVREEGPVRCPDRLDGVDRALPLMLCVGRLHPVKQQDVLVEAWLEAGLDRSGTLLLIGGSAENPTAVEREMRARIEKLLAGLPRARRRVALRPALANRDVRLLEHALAGTARPGGAVYVCPSAKEEFGIAVLEAMSAGLPAAGPRRGGVPHYLRHGENGFLLDTTSAATLAAGLRTLSAVPREELARLAARGRETVRRDFSVAAMATALAAEYRVREPSVRPERA